MKKGAFEAVNAVRESALPLTGSDRDYDPLLEMIGDAPFVLLGEASHGTHEFYRERAEITKRLVREKGFIAVAAEADWPDAFRADRFARGLGSDADAEVALSGFKRFPQWMWRNADVLDFVGWLRAHNEALPPERRVGFYGLDLYSLHASIESVLGYLDKVDPDGARRARYRYGCFDHFGEDPQAYGYATAFGLSQSCEQEVVGQLVELRTRAAELANRDGRVAADEFFSSEMNARVVHNAERYYRSMFQGPVVSWNLRDQHMVETLEALVRHLHSRGQVPKIVVWEHNSHLGDARATDMGGGGKLNVGQFVRERYGSNAVLVGFTTYTGTVTAATDWGGPAERKHVQPGMCGSYEALFHEVGIPRFLLLLPQGAKVSQAVRGPMLERAIGVIYLPDTERVSHYFDARLSEQFDAVLHFDDTRAVEPLERTAEWQQGELAETYPSGF
jgi:erythromycin esterase-like protein